MLSLADLKIGDKADVVGFDEQNASFRQKLFAFGLIPGSVLSIANIAPLGDPFQVELDNGVTLSIRKSEGRGVKVEKIF